jgi:hypothetical protein
MYDINSELTTLRAVFYNSFRAAVRPIGGAETGKGSLLEGAHRQAPPRKFEKRNLTVNPL